MIDPVILIHMYQPNPLWHENQVDNSFRTASKLTGVKTVCFAELRL